MRPHILNVEKPVECSRSIAYRYLLFTLIMHLPNYSFFCLAFDNNSIRHLARAPITILHYTYIASKRSKNEGWIYA